MNHLYKDVFEDKFMKASKVVVNLVTTTDKLWRNGPAL